jgi:hypothetical protein
MFSDANNKDNNENELTTFESKVVLFSLTVSDFTIINMSENVDNETTKIL